MRNEMQQIAQLSKQLENETDPDMREELEIKLLELQDYLDSYDDSEYRSYHSKSLDF